MTQVNDIRKMYFEEGKSISEVSRKSGTDRKTVRNYIGKDDWNKEVQKVEKQASYPKLERFMQEIDSWLLDDQKAKRKQRHTAKRVFVRLSEAHRTDFDCSYRTVAGYVAMKKKEIYSNSRGYLPLEHIPGEAQADFGAAEFYENGRRYDGKYINLSFPYSNAGYLQLFKGENQECLFEGLSRIFRHMGHTPCRIWFDNAGTMVSNVIKGGVRELTEAFIRFKEHHRFEAAFCNLDAGHEKGNVEAKVGYHRRNMLVPVPRFGDVDVFNRELLARCDEDMYREHYRKDADIFKLFEEDKRAMPDLPSVPFDCSRHITVNTNAYGRFYLEKGLHEYSASPKYANKKILVRITASEVMPLDESHRCITVHDRLYGNYRQQSMDWLPYLSQLSRYPGALKYSGVYAQMPEPLREYLDRCSKPEKGKILKAIAELTEKSGFGQAVETVTSALNYGVVDVDSLINIHNRLHGVIIKLDPVKTSAVLPSLKAYAPDFSVYDSRLGKAGESQ